MKWDIDLDETFISDLEDLIINSVKAGFYSNEEILEECMEMLEFEYDETNITDNDILNIIEQARNEYENIGNEKVYHTLNKVFDDLTDKGIIALHYAGYSQQDGFSDCNEEACERKQTNENVIGCCFYTMQDLKRILDEKGHLYLSFGSYSDEYTTVDIGKIIVKELSAAGFNTEWNETEKEKISIKDIKWDKQYNENE